MKLFPTNQYSIELWENSSFAIAELKKETLSDEQFIVDSNDKAFIGKVDELEFEIKLTKRLYGAYCVINGNLEIENGVLNIRINKMFKIIFIIFYLYPIIGFIISLIFRGFENSVELIIPTFSLVLMVRFIFVELCFRIISKMGLNKLTNVIGIKSLKKTRHNNVYKT